MSDLLSDFIHKGVKPIVRGPTVNGRYEVESKFPEDYIYSSSDEDINENYAEQYVEREMKKYEESKVQMEEALDSECQLNVDDIAGELAGSDIRSEVYRVARIPEIYAKYNFESTIPKRDLTIDAYKEKILNVIRANSVMVIDGPTGCGKTTQVPQYILDDCRAMQKDCNIVVTQPRKIATINVTKRVCHERGWALGTICGYQVGLEKQLGPDVILSYMTTGVLLQKLIHAKSLNDYTHIVVDEVHERNQDLDFLLLVIRKLLFTKSYQTKVILMSATIDAKEFAHYFRNQYKGTDIFAPTINIREPNKFALTIYYMNNLPMSKNTTDYDKNKPEISDVVINTFLFLMTVFNKLDEVDSETNETRIGSVLVFLPGIREIEEMQKVLIEKHDALLTSDPANARIKWDIVPLHSSLPNDEQAKVFKPVNPPFRKVILSTNIAESSITVPDICYVVDFCLTKNMVVDKVTKYSSLRLEWASHVNCDQRAGRAGRVSNGRVYRLVSQEFYQEYMDRKTTPEIMRAPLESVVLHAKMLELSEEPKAILALAISPPDLTNLENTIWHLKEIGALLPTCNGLPNISDGDITFLGTVMASLPLDVCFSKLIVLGHMFSVLHEAIIMAAGCAIQNIFATPFTQRLQAYNKKILWADGSCSDFIALLNLYKVWESCKRDGAFKRPHEEFAWCKANFVSLKGLREWQLLIGEIQARLRRFGIDETSGPARVNLTSLERPTVLKVIICGAFYPNFFLRRPDDGQADEREATRTVGGRDPYRTVYLTGIEGGQPGSLYTKDVMKMLDLRDDAKVEFDCSGKIYISFKNYKEPETVTVDNQSYVTTIPGKIPMQVYYAVKKRRMKLPMVLKMLPKDLAWEHLAMLEEREKKRRLCAPGPSGNQMGIETKKTEVNCFSQVEYDRYPSLDTEYITVAISNRLDAGHFFCQNVYDGTQDILDEINKALNTMPLSAVNVKDLRNDELYACKYLEDGQYYRSRIHVKLSETEAQVIFVDYGNIQVVKLKDLCKLPNKSCVKVAPLAIECVLSEIEPVYDVHRKGIWSERVNEIFDIHTENTILYGKVYSVCDEVVHLELFKEIPNGPSSGAVSLNQWLIREGHARKTEESFLSKEDHKKRQSVLESANPQKEAKRLLVVPKKKEIVDIEPSLKGVENFVKEVSLMGPYSPLEMKIYSAIAHGMNKAVEIEPSSVNSVLLDNDPIDPNTKLIVAASVNQTSSGDRLLLRQTTIMPNIPGFPALMALLFCPQMEPKLNEDGSQISSLLCGLGAFETSGRACYPSHDMVLTLDIEVNEDVINAVNELRYAMNSSLDVMNRIYDTEGKIEEIEPYQRSVKVKIFQYLKMKLKSVKPFHNVHAEVWKNYPIDLEILKAQVDKEMLWPLHWFVKIVKLDDEPSKLYQNIKDLNSMAKKLIPFEETKCKLCDKDLTTLGKLRNHLISPIHKKNEFDLKLKHKLV